MRKVRVSCCPVKCCHARIYKANMHLQPSERVRARERYAGIDALSYSCCTHNRTSLYIKLNWHNLNIIHFIQPTRFSGWVCVCVCAFKHPIETNRRLFPSFINSILAFIEPCVMHPVDNSNIDFEALSYFAFHFKAK